MKQITQRTLLVPFVAGLVVLAWLVLWLWERSPYGRYLAHGELAHFDLSGGLEPLLFQVSVYVLGWLLMTAAMMLPTALPLVNIFQRLTSLREDRTRLVVLVVLGYLAVWLAFGIAAHVFDLGLHEAFGHSDLLQRNAWVFGAAPLVVAGVFQFTALKYRCLDKCRAPLSFVVQHWSGRDSRLQAFGLGAHHGMFCVGCCWALMLLMFAVGTGSVGWMLALGALMAIEKNVSWGRRISAPLGVVLIAWGALIALDHSWSWQA